MPGVYLSYPFCAQKCTFCNFASGVFPAALEQKYLAALRAELAAHRWAWMPETVYFGGGTPSSMAPEAVAALLALIPGRPWQEACMEAAPGTITAKTAAAWVAAGVNRVSLGVQSFVKRELARTGRKHDAHTVAQDLQWLREAGLTDVNLDLIAGLPGQTPQSWDESLDWIERLQAPHVSVYILEVDEDSALGQEVLLNGRRYGAPDVPSEESTAVLYERAVERLAAMGIARYEISNFARPGHESRHNLKYWRLEPYAGFGADAHSFDGVWRSQNVEQAAEYAARGERGEPVCTERVPATLDEERFFVGLRLMAGIEPQPEEWERFAAPIQRFVQAGLLEKAGPRLRLTPRGVLLSNEVFQEFIAA